MKNSFKVIDQCESVSGKKIIVRADFNVHIKDGKVAEGFRIQKTLKTLDFLLKSGAQVIAISHIDEKEGNTLEPVARYLLNFFPTLRFIKDIYSPDARSEVSQMKDGEIVLFENLRLWEGEKANTPSFAKHLASFGDVFVNDGFAVSHRKHSSVVGIPQYLPSYAGFLLKEEVETLSLCFNPKHPFLFILGGAKFDTKLPLVSKFIKTADMLFVGGALANDIFKARGLFVGDSLVSNIDVSEYGRHPKVFVPIDVRTQHKGFHYTKKPNEISVNERIWDIGPDTTKFLKDAIEKSAFIVWNGPMGNYEQGFIEGTKELAQMIASSNAKTIIGGGDIVALLNSLEMLPQFSFISTGGAAMLEFLANETLPGIDALRGVLSENNTEKKQNWLKKIFS